MPCKFQYSSNERKDRVCGVKTPKSAIIETATRNMTLQSVFTNETPVEES